MTAPASPTERSAMIFDVEGTLVDAVPYTLQCWQETLQHFGYEVPRSALLDRSGLDGHDMLRELLPDVPDAQRKTILKHQGRSYRERYLMQVKPFAGVRTLFATIRQTGLKIALATDCSRDELHRYLEIAAVEDLVDTSACGDDVARGKPHTDLLALALKRLAIEAPDAFMVGDTPYDMAAARTLGLPGIGVLTGGATEARLKNAGAFCICTAVSDLRDPLDIAGASRLAAF